MDFKTELNILKDKKGGGNPSNIQRLIDNGLLQQCEECDGIYYVTFAFRVVNRPVYNYEYEKGNSNFELCEICSVIYCGGMAIGPDMSILKGVIYPYYYGFKLSDSSLFDTTISNNSIIRGTPQIIYKNMGTKLEDWFSDKFFSAYNILTNDANAFADFIKGEENYEGCRVYMKDKFERCDYGNFYGYINQAVNDRTKILHCPPTLLFPSDVVTLEWVSDFIKDETINRNIATKIYCSNIIKKSLNNIGNNISRGAHELSENLYRAGSTVDNTTEIYIHNSLL